MNLFKDKFKITSNRFKHWDYSSEAVYFITIVTKERQCIFGSVEDGKMILNENGMIVENELLKSIKIRKNWFFHNWVVMPNHIHLLIEIQDVSNTKKSETQIVDTNTNVMQIVETHSSASTSSISTTIDSKNLQTLSTNFAETHSCAPLRKNGDELNFSRKSHSISSFVAIFKSITTKQINGQESIWQKNYHDHIVRNYKRFETIYNYIKNNPQSWDTDSINSNFQ